MFKFNTFFNLGSFCFLGCIASLLSLLFDVSIDMVAVGFLTNGFLGIVCIAIAFINLELKGK